MPEATGEILGGLLHAKSSEERVVGARAADIDLERVKVLDDLRLTYPHFSFATWE